MTTLHLQPEVADALLIARGWTIDEQRDRSGRPFVSYTRPGARNRSDGGICGADYLWERDEALMTALTAEAQNVAVA